MVPRSQKIKYIILMLPTGFPMLPVCLIIWQNINNLKRIKKSDGFYK